MVSSIGSMTTDLLQNYRQMQFSSGTTQNDAPQSFEEIMGSKTENPQSSSIDAGGIQGAFKAEKDESSSSTKSEMDLNQDGVVTIDEVMQYVSMQMAQQMQEQMAADQGSDEMSQEAEQNNQQQKADVQDFKALQATQAYQIGENMLTASIGAVTQSFAV